jgi:hypothetical protein
MVFLSASSAERGFVVFSGGGVSLVAGKRSQVYNVELKRK